MVVHSGQQQSHCGINATHSWIFVIQYEHSDNDTYGTIHLFTISFIFSVNMA